MGGLGPHFGGPGHHFGPTLGVWAGSGSQMRLGRRFGAAPGSQDGSKLKPKMEPSWTQKGIKIDAQIAQLFDAIKNRILMDFGKENGAKMVAKLDRKSIATLKAKNQLNASRLVFS